MKSKLKILSLLPAIFIMLVIFHFSSQTSTQSSGLSSNYTHRIFAIIERTSIINFNETMREIWLGNIEILIRKAAHMTEYAILAIMVSFPFYVYGRRSGRLLLQSVAVCVLYAATDEFHQLFVLGRSGQVFDVIIDGCGAVIGCLIFIVISKKKYIIISS